LAIRKTRTEKGGEVSMGRHRESVDTDCVDDAKRALTAIDERHTAGSKVDLPGPEAPSSAMI
jgi:hypothetical protein